MSEEQKIVRRQLRQLLLVLLALGGTTLTLSVISSGAGCGSGGGSSKDNGGALGGSTTGGSTTTSTGGSTTTSTGGSTTTSTGGSTTTTSSTGHAYVLMLGEAGSSSILQFKIGSDGTLSVPAPSPSPVPAGIYSQSIVMTSDGKFVYVPDQDSNSVWQYAIGAAGALTPLNPPAVDIGGVPSPTPQPVPGFAAIDTTGSFLFVSDEGTSNIARFSINSTTGLLTPLTPASGAGSVPYGICVSGPFMYAANYAGSSVEEYVIVGSSPSPSPTPIPAGNAPIVVTADPSGKFFYAGDYQGLIFQFSIGGDGSLKPLSTPSFTSGTSVNDIVINPAGTLAFISNVLDNKVSQYQLTNTGLLTPLGTPTVNTGTNPSGLAFDPTGHFLYVTNYQDNTISQFAVGATGLSPLTPATVPAALPSQYPVAMVTRGP